MRFLNTETLAFEEVEVPEPKSYAILSHTWGDGEVTFRDMADMGVASLKAGFDKIAKTCLLARLEGYRLVWVDTCCIDKSSSAELSEAINSMFSLYAESGKCFVYLGDYHSDVFIDTEFAACRWFTRGWTLQELIAPDELQFYQAGWQAMGTKRSLLGHIHNITRIPAVVLEDREAAFSCCIAQRMSWAAGRVTKRAEDVAYCLLGLFRVNMPMLYGMGKRAFLRLQEEIIKDTNDLSIFAWVDRSLSADTEHGVLADSPSAFKGCSNLIFSEGATFTGSFSITNGGLQICTVLYEEWCTMRFTDTPWAGGEEEEDPTRIREKLYYLQLCYRDPTVHRADIMLVLRKQGDMAQFCRIRCNNFSTAERVSHTDGVFKPYKAGVFLAVTPQQLCSTGYLLISHESASPEISCKVIASYPTGRWDADWGESVNQCRFRLTEGFLGFRITQLFHQHYGDLAYALEAFWLEPSLDSSAEPFVRCSINYRQPVSWRFLRDYDDSAESKIVSSPSISLSDAQSMLAKEWPGFGTQQSASWAITPRRIGERWRDRKEGDFSATLSVPETVRPLHYEGSRSSRFTTASTPQRLCYSVQIKIDLKYPPTAGQTSVPPATMEG
ncbi:hypothetical protein GGTG_05502 [Gaeumannomyces tritici R3-111a-1]|uniref:Uncharacterized protein n=1 Tax=Gaeumannomyces tritici (strain R3-111a-1) TaxID=644352 RepID=J3NW39_GAET3|nr:hypothetical protein GGTG_05502 [Gaeumannomyces tritici R3-111a-1]EJT75569.1 hypothetical protein GGTG_05502 [Gaeumannomyces tritici R3-111a-1]